jgi:hypothetical protein
VVVDGDLVALVFEEDINSLKQEFLEKFNLGED